MTAFLLRPAWLVVLAALAAPAWSAESRGLAVEPATAGEPLPALLARALPRDPQVQTALAQLEIARERERQARSRLGPSLVASATRGGERAVELGRMLERHTDRAEAGLRWNLYNYGDDAAELAGAGRDTAAAVQELRRAREEAAERIATAAAELQRLDGLLPRALQRLDDVQRLVRQVQRQAELGKASDADAQQAQVSLLDAQIAHEQLLLDREGAQRRLAVLAGEPVGPLQPLAQDFAAGTGGADAAVPPDLAAAQPGVVSAAQLRAQAARERVRPVASVLAPRVDLEYRQRLSDRTSPALTTEQQNGWQLVARWELPLGGELPSRRRETQRRAEAAEAEAERTLRGVQADLVALGPREAASRRALAQLDDQVQRYDALLRAAALQFDAGRRTLAQLLQLHDARFNAQQRRADMAHQLRTAQLHRLALEGSLLQALQLASQED
ncbi:TolC family protein [Azohydromonas aeria]|uniref:TolC family protein n=1 Tax=Azohydromonas aeria TaxID=2590212 RepID=UPI0018DF9762|nr:TolC family protein [Azohydromonas aeria]